MEKPNIAIVGVGATGTVLAAAILSTYPETVLVGHHPGAGDTLLSKGLRVSGAISCQSTVKNFISQIKGLKHANPNLIFLATKTFHLDQILKELEDVYRPGIKIISTQNGLGTEDLIADKFGADACFKEALAVARGLGYDIGEGYVEQAVTYLMKAGVHRDSMCFDIEKKAPTEIDFLGGKVVEYARQNSVATPCFIAMTNLVKAIEDNYLKI
jgi:ketopantoate reductase